MKLRTSLGWLLLGIIGCWIDPIEKAGGQGLAVEIAEAAIESADLLDPAAIGDVDSTARGFADAVQELRDYLGVATTAENAQAWLDYLEIPVVQDAVAAGESEAELARRLIRVVQRATGLHPGLELPAIMQLRDAADAYANALRFRNRESISNALSRQLERFGEQWSELAEDPTPDELATLNLILDLLDRTNQQVPLVERTRRRFSRPNVHFMVGEALVAQAVRRNVNQRSDVRDCILGTRIIGDAVLNGDVTATLLPSEGSVRVQLALNGTVNSNNVGYNGPVRLRTSGVGQVHATRVVEISEDGPRFDPVVSSGTLTTRIHAIEHHLRLVRKIARKKAAQQKPLAERIARGKLLARVAEGFAEETAAAASMPDGEALDRVRPFLKRLGLDEPVRRFGSTDRSVFLFATVRDGNQLAAADVPPPVREMHDLTVQVHESLVNNTIGAVLADRTLTRGELQRLADRSGRGKSTATPEQASEAKETDFEIDFDANRPIIFEPRDGRLRVGIRGTRFAQGSRELQRPLEVVAEYRPLETESGRVVLQRVGDVEINFPGRKRLSVSEAGLRGSIKQGFVDAFPAQLMDQPWTLPEDFAVPALRGMSLVPRYFDAREGWLSLGVAHLR